MKHIKNKSNGFTLLEVLVALVILAVSLTAIYKAVAENINDTSYLQDKTAANWVALNSLAAIKLGIFHFPSSTEQINQISPMFSQRWYWQANLSTTQDPHLRQVNVVVSTKPGGTAIIDVKGFLGN